MLLKMDWISDLMLTLLDIIADEQVIDRYMRTRGVKGLLDRFSDNTDIMEVFGAGKSTTKDMLHRMVSHALIQYAQNIADVHIEPTMDDVVGYLSDDAYFSQWIYGAMTVDDMIAHSSLEPYDEVYMDALNEMVTLSNIIALDFHSFIDYNYIFDNKKRLYAYQ
jgi:hypothetical protein